MGSQQPAANPDDRRPATDFEVEISEPKTLTREQLQQAKAAAATENLMHRNAETAGMARAGSSSKAAEDGSRNLKNTTHCEIKT